ncbi:hypothetical protein Tco_1353103 [Tanacetum coccineum]
MAPKRATRSTPVTENPTTTTVTNAQLQAMIDQGVTAALTARDANRNGDDSHTSGTGARRTERVTRECTYQDFMKCQPLYFKGTCMCKGTEGFTSNRDGILMKGELMDKKISTFAERQAENKRKLDNNHQAQQQLPKRQNVVQAYAAVTGERKEYAGTLPLCNKCKFHHNGPCTVKCANCKRGKEREGKGKERKPDQRKRGEKWEKTVRKKEGGEGDEKEEKGEELRRRKGGKKEKKRNRKKKKENRESGGNERERERRKGKKEERKPRR